MSGIMINLPVFPTLTPNILNSIDSFLHYADLSKTINTDHSLSLYSILNRKK